MGAEILKCLSVCRPLAFFTRVALRVAVTLRDAHTNNDHHVLARHLEQLANENDSFVLHQRQTLHTNTH